MAPQNNALDNAKVLRRNQTDAEKILWRHLRNNSLGVKFRRQVPIGPYVVDFICLEKRLIVEADGGQHNDNPKDILRTSYLESLGYKVIRFWNNDILGNTEGVLSTLTLTLSQREREQR